MTRRTQIALALLTLLAAALRFATLDAKGFWGDEISTVILVHQRYDGMLGHVANLESTPPLYYSLAWVWAKAFGTTEIGLRALSAVLGLATVPLVYLAARELVSRRAALVSAALVAVNPVLVWYSGEARSYALLVFLSAAGLWCFARALHTPARRALALWALSSALAVATHYFAVFLVVPEAVVLIRRRRDRWPTVAAVAGVGAALAAILPLALHQASRGHATWIAHSSLAGRVASLPGDLTLGFDARPRAVFGVASALAIATGAWLVLRRATGRDRGGAAIVGGVALAALAIPVTLALLGVDYMTGRNSLAATIPLAVAVGAGYAAPGRLARIAMAGLAAISLAVVIATAGLPKFHSEDWRSAAEDLGGSGVSRAIVATPGQAGRKPLEYYLGAARLGWGRRVLVGEVDVVALPRQGESHVGRVDLSRLLRLRLPGFRLVRTHVERGFALLAYRAARPQRVSQAMLDGRVQRGAATVVAEPWGEAAQAAARWSAAPE